ncbi:hypothetical protein M422DRAFT_68313 [Sphaerobolus stellatus SS14]|uniref:Peroxidase n=1 Tax=Sphaerobolus stellatus (strain SS14) TaxID=990650 RepID=A0A0C9UE26_SPHS4|nr:hypothetical protein M422DRAFT_68313 [Sphaerobolus stellatus SS14]
MPAGDANIAARETHPVHSLMRRVDIPPACQSKVTRRSYMDFSIAKRIAQEDLPAVAQTWQTACLASGGDITTNDPCVQLAGVRGINSLLAGGAPCDQQDVADDMITFAKSAGVTNSAALIQIAKDYRVHPRNALALDGNVTPSTPFCQTAPKNPELNGLVNGQLNGVDPFRFGGPKFAVVAFGDPVSCPFGQTPDVDSCTCVAGGAANNAAAPAPAPASAPASACPA